MQIYAADQGSTDAAVIRKTMGDTSGRTRLSDDKELDVMENWRLVHQNQVRAATEVINEVLSHAGF